MAALGLKEMFLQEMEPLDDDPVFTNTPKNGVKWTFRCQFAQLQVMEPLDDDPVFTNTPKNGVKWTFRCQFAQLQVTQSHVSEIGHRNGVISHLVKRRFPEGLRVLIGQYWFSPILEAVRTSF